MTSRIKLGSFLDVLVVDEPSHIRFLDAHPQVTRALPLAGGPLHRMLHRRTAVDMRLDRGVLPAFLIEGHRTRRERQRALRERLAALGDEITPETRKIARYVSGLGRERDLGPLVQQWAGRLFDARYTGTSSTYRAARRFADVPSSPRTPFWRRSGKLERSRRALETAAGGDPWVVHATSVAVTNLMTSLQRMRRLLASPDAARLSSAEAVRRTLRAPDALVRGCLGGVEAPFLDTPLTPKTLIVYRIQAAYDASRDADVAFLAHSYGACPAQQVVLDMLELVWALAAGHLPIDTTLAAPRSNTRTAAQLGQGAPPHTEAGAASAE